MPGSTSEEQLNELKAQLDTLLLKISNLLTKKSVLLSKKALTDQVNGLKAQLDILQLKINNSPEDKSTLLKSIEFANQVLVLQLENNDLRSSDAGYKQTMRGLKKSNDDLTEVNDNLQGHMRSLARKLSIRTWMYTVAFVLITPILGFFGKVGIAALAEKYVDPKYSTAVYYTLVSICLGFCLSMIGCVIKNAMDSGIAKILEEAELDEKCGPDYDQKLYSFDGSEWAITKWQRRFVDKRNIWINLSYYFITAVTSLFFVFIGYVAVLGVDHEFSKVQIPNVPTRIVTIAVSIFVSFLCLGANWLFISALQRMLYHRPPEFLPSGVIIDEKTKAELRSTSDGNTFVDGAPSNISRHASDGDIASQNPPLDGNTNRHASDGDIDKGRMKKGYEGGIVVQVGTRRNSIS